MRSIFSDTILQYSEISMKTMTKKNKWQKSGVALNETVFIT